MPKKRVCLDDYRGETLQDFLVDEVDINWHDKMTYEFYQSRNNDRQKIPSFTVLSKPTPNQPGNGVVKFLDLHDYHYMGYSHKYLKDVYHYRDFPQLRTDYLQRDLGNVEEDKTLAANVLFSFEIARRVDEEEKTYPLTRSEVEEAIKYVMALRGKKYDKKVKILQKIFDAEIDPDRTKSYLERCKKRSDAFERLMGWTPRRLQDDSGSSNESDSSLASDLGRLDMRS